MYGICPRCDARAPHSKPNCPSCGFWQPWGDEAVAAERAERLRRFRESELQTEREWAELRADEFARCSAAPSLAFRLWALVHELRQRPALGVPALLAAVIALGLAGSAIRARLPRHTPNARAVATARCNDGTWSYARNRAGACSDHDGVKVFYR